MENLVQDSTQSFLKQICLPNQDSSQVNQSISHLLGSIERQFDPVQILLGATLLLMRNSSEVELAITQLNSFAKISSSQGLPLIAFWIPEDEYDEYSFATVVYVAMSIAQELTGDPVFTSSLEMLLEKYSRVEEKSQVVRASLEAFLVEHPDEEVALTNQWPLKYHHFGRFECSLGFPGSHRGFGSLRFGSLEIVAMGYGLEPLGEMEKFGLLEGEVEFGSGINWVRMKQDNSLDGDLWAELGVIGLEDGVKIVSRIENFGEIKPLTMTFFLGDGTLIVDQEERSFGLLERFRGDVASIGLQSGKESFEIVVPEDSPCQIIPLSGEGNYWGAKYLVAFEMKNFETQSQWDIRAINSLLS